MAVDIENHPVSEDSEVNLVPLVVENFWFLPGQGLQFPVVVEDGELDGVPGGIEAHRELRLARTIRDLNGIPFVVPRTSVSECRHETELLRKSLVEDSQGWHLEVCCRVDPVSSLHPVGTPNSADSRESIQIDIQLKLSDKVVGLEIIIARLVVSAGIDNFFCITWLPSRIGLGGGPPGCPPSWSPCCPSCGRSSGCCWWLCGCRGWCGLAEQEAGIIVVLVCVHTGNLELLVLLSQPLVWSVGRLEGSVAVEEPIVPDREAALLLELVVPCVSSLHPHFSSSASQIPARVGGRLE